MITAVWVGGPLDGAEWQLSDPSRPVWVLLDPPLVQALHETDANMEGAVEVRPVRTRHGWRLYWPRGC